MMMTSPAASSACTVHSTYVTSVGLLSSSDGRALAHGPHLDRAHPRESAAGGEGQRRVEILHVDQHVAAEVLARLGEWSVGQQRLAVTHAHARRGRDGLQRIAGQVLATGPQLLGELGLLPEELL